MRELMLKIRTSELVPQGEVWFVNSIGYEKRESVSRRGWTLTIYEKFRVIGRLTLEAQSAH